MNKLHVVKVRFSFDNHWNCNESLQYSEENGVFEYDNSKDVYRGKDVHISKNITWGIDGTSIELVQGFVTPLGVEELFKIQRNMELKFASILNEYKSSLLGVRKKGTSVYKQ